MKILFCFKLEANMKMIRNLLILLIIIGSPCLAAEGMSLEQIAKLRAVGQAVVSPDGNHIAYIRVVPRDLSKDDDGGAWTELHVIDATGHSRPYISGQVNVGTIGWLPDGSAITFLSRRGGDEQRQLHSIPLAGGEASRLTSVPTGVAAYSISPDGKQVALLATEELSKAERDLRAKGFDQVIFEEDWRPRRLWMLDLEDPDAEPTMIDVEGSLQSVDWSPAGDRLAIVVTPRQLVDDTLMFQRIRLISPQGEELGRIDNPGKLGPLVWSADGRHLAFIATETIHDPREGRLMVAGRNGGQWTNLLPDLAGHVWQVAWRGNDEVVFVSHEGVETRLGLIDINDGVDQTLARQDGLILGGISVADSGRIVMTASSPGHPGELFSLDNGEDTPQRLTDSNPWLADVRLARQEVVTYQAEDGLDIEGLLVWPLDYREGQRYPLILAVHGGPEAHYSNGWLTTYNLPAQHAAAQGYFMFYQNYRGSTGRGVDFTFTSQGRPAKEEFSDLVDGVDYLIERGLVDGDRVGITGGSYGGYASAWAATYYSDRFAASVMNVGLSDKISMLGTSDIPQELYLVHYRTWPWEDWDLYVKASPIYYVQQARTPILILHGDADPRVDPTQSKIFYRYLVLQDDPPPVRLVLYRGEGHGNQRAASRWDYSLRLMRWMDHYLKGEGGEPPPYQIDYRLPDDSDD
jgi:dipeptidyl aminopeptidase/acylaminoacyl peptidase